VFYFLQQRHGKRKRNVQNQVDDQEHRPQKCRSCNSRSRNALRDWL